MRFIDMSDAAKARECRRNAAKTDWAAEMIRIEREAVALKAAPVPARTERRRERDLERLRQEWRSARDMRDFVATGINRAHVGLRD